MLSIMILRKSAVLNHYIIAVGINLYTLRIVEFHHGLEFNGCKIERHREFIDSDLHLCVEISQIIVLIGAAGGEGKKCYSSGCSRKNFGNWSNIAGLCEIIRLVN